MGQGKRTNGIETSALDSGASHSFNGRHLQSLCIAFPHKVQYNDAAVLERDGGERLS